MDKMKYCVVPTDDLWPHDEYSKDCPCGVRVEEFENAILYIHNSFDGREDFEGWQAEIVQ